MQLRCFVAYVDFAQNGRNALWRIVLGVAVIAAVWLAGTFAIISAGAVAVLASRGDWPADSDQIFDAAYQMVVHGGQIGTIVQLLSIASLWIGVWLALKLVHKRSIFDLFGVERRLRWPDFMRGAVVTLIVGGIAMPIGLMIDPTFERSDISLSSWLVAALPLVLACFLQSSAEELLFRGYFHQALAARFVSPLIWVLLPTGLFTLLHWDSGVSTAMNMAALLVIFAFSLSMTVLLIASGNLAAAMGAHLGNNIGAIMLFSSQPHLGSAALFLGRSTTDPSWTLWQAMMLGVYGVAVVAITQVLLLHRSSPLRLRSLS